MTNRKKRNTVPQLIFIVFVFASLSSARPPTDAQEQLNALAKNYSGGIALGWVDEDGIAFLQSGQFSDDDPRPITPDTQFELGSVTKVFTALLLSESERLGRVCRHDSAAKYLLHPDDPDQASLAKITLYSLTTHTSGLPRMPSNFDNTSDTLNFARYDRAMLIEALREHGPYAPVGLKVVYSNYGVAVLAEALASAWGMTYAEALRKYVLGPLGLNHTTLGITGMPEPPNLAPGHENNNVTDHWTFLSFAGAGGLRSSSRELARFVREAIRTAPLHEAFVDTMRPRIAVEDSNTPLEVGLGWFILPGDRERPIVSHDGATGGFTSLVAISRKERRGVVLLTNGGASINPLGYGLLESSNPPPVSWAVENALDYTGRYALTSTNFSTLAMDITEVGGTLSERVVGELREGTNDRCFSMFEGINYFAPNLEKWELREKAPDLFSVVDIPAEISFERGANGQVVALALHYSSCDMPGLRGALPPAS